MRYWVRQLLPIGLLITGSPASAQSHEVEVLLDDLVTAQNDLATLEARFNRNDLQLVEVLEQLADQYIALNQFEQAHTTLDRATQIIRMSEGLFTPAQLPFLEKKLINYANRSDWPRARAQMEHLLWLLQEKIPITDALVSHLMTLSEVRLRGVAEDDPVYQGQHFLQAMEANRMALIVATSVWGEKDLRLVPILYQMVKQHYLQTVAIDKGGETGYQLRELVPGSRWVYDKTTMRRAHYHIGNRLLQQIRFVHAQQIPANFEAIAMVDLYLADWQVMHTRRGEALVHYEEAYNGLLQAGVGSDELARFFALPEVLPASEFHASISKALAARASMPPGIDDIPAASIALQFVEWSPAFPNVRAPTGSNSHMQAEGKMDANSNFALFSFSLSGLKQVSRWMSGSFRAGIGVVDEAELLQMQLNSPMEEEGLLGKLHTLRFRPSLRHGTPVDASGTLLYVVAN